MLSKDEIEDARALRRLLQDKALYPALERLILRMELDLVRRFTEDQAIKRQYVRGGREALAQVLPNIKETAERLREHEEAEQDLARSVRSVTEDGLGSGDLAS